MLFSAFFLPSKFSSLGYLQDLSLIRQSLTCHLFCALLVEVVDSLASESAVCLPSFFVVPHLSCSKEERHVLLTALVVVMPDILLFLCRVVL